MITQILGYLGQPLSWYFLLVVCNEGIVTYWDVCLEFGHLTGGVRLLRALITISMKSPLIICVVLGLAGCAAQANTGGNTAAPITSPAYGPQSKVSVFIRGLDDTAASSLVQELIQDQSCRPLRVVERSFGYLEVACNSVDGAGRVANAFQSVAKQMGIDLSASHSGDQVLMRKID